MSPTLGAKVTDRITGFTGIAVGVVNYISGCSQALVSPKVSENGDFKESQWFDIQRLVVSDEPAIQLDNGRTPGADKAAPKR